MISLDDLDHTLISALRHNARTPVSSLAAATGASRATVAARIDRLVSSGTIAAFTIRTGAELSGSGVQGHRDDRDSRQDGRQGCRRNCAACRRCGRFIPPTAAGISSPNWRTRTSPLSTRRCGASG